MTDHAKALDALIEAVEAGTVRPYVIEEMAARIFSHYAWPKAGPAYNGSLDAAVALKDALLPGWAWGITQNHDQDPCALAINEDLRIVERACSPTPSRALLLAILKAYRHTLETRA